MTRRSLCRKSALKAGGQFNEESTTVLRHGGKGDLADHWNDVALVEQILALAKGTSAPIVLSALLTAYMRAAEERGNALAGAYQLVAMGNKALQQQILNEILSRAGAQFEQQPDQAPPGHIVVH